MIPPEDARPLGRSPVRVSRLTLGCAPLGNLFAPVAPADALATVEAAYQAGIRSFDAAPLYGNGLAERRLGVALDGCRDVVLSTKVGRRLVPLRGHAPDRSLYVDLPPFHAAMDYSFDGVLRQAEDSLQRLGRDALDVALIHDYTPRHDPRHDPALFEAAMDGAYRALVRLRAEGVVRAVGFGVNHVDLALAFLNAGDFDCAMLAGRYSLLDRSAEAAFLPLCLERGVGVMLAAPFASGLLASDGSSRARARYRYDPPPPDVLAATDRLEEACRSFGLALATVALCFPFRHPAVTTVVVGARTADEIRTNAAALACPVPDELWAALARIAPPGV